jgi:transposase
MAQRGPPLDTTSFSRRGDDVPESDEQAIPLTHGSAKDHRPDCKQAVLERIVSPDGGVPLVRNSGEGHASDTPSVQERAQALLTAFARAPTPRYLVADATRYPADSAAPLAKRGCVTRIPGTRKRVSQVISHALAWDVWHARDDRTRDQRLEGCHDGMAQRWLVGSSQAARERAEASGTKAQPRAWEAMAKPRLP